MDRHRVGDDESPGDVIARVVRDDILAGRRAAGERLVEEAIAKEFGVSRVPVREALGQLEGEGFVTTVRYRGATVSTTLRKDNRELLQVRRGLEVLAARLAAQNRGGAVAEELAPYARDHPADVDGPAGRWSFHELVATAAGNDQLRQLLATVSRRVAWGLGDDPETSRHDHAAVAAAILSGAAFQAGHLMDEHLQRDEQPDDGSGVQP